MSFDEYQIGEKAKRYLLRMHPDVRSTVEKKLDEIRIYGETHPAWTEETMGPDDGRGDRRFRVSEVGVSIWVYYNSYIKKTGTTGVYVQTVTEAEAEESEEIEILFFCQDKVGRPPIEKFLEDARATGEKGFAKFLAVVVELIEGTIEYPHVKALKEHPGLSELREDFDQQWYRAYFGYIGKNALLIKGFVKKADTQPKNQKIIDSAFKLLKIAEKNLDGNSLTMDEVKSRVIREFLVDVQEKQSEQVESK